MKKSVLIRFIFLSVSLLFLLSCSIPSCDLDECVIKSGVFCKDDKMINLTYACINDRCSIFSNSTFDCNSLTKRSCFNISVASIEKYYCLDASCVGSVEIVECGEDESCISGYCTRACGNGKIDEGENCENCPQDIECKEGEKCLNGLCVPEDFEEKVCLYDTDCDDENPCTVDYCDKQRGKCSNKFIRDKVPSFCCEYDLDCDDSNTCTEDSCFKHKCIHDKIEDCCNLVDDCDDKNICTEDSCVGHACLHDYKVILDHVCCNRDEDCDDGDICTIDFCDGDDSSRRCFNERIIACCNTADDCDDSDPCTLDSCKDNKCSNKAVSSNISYENSGNCSSAGETVAYEHCVLDFYSEFFDIEKTLAWCKKKDCLAENICMKECSVLSIGKDAYICKTGKWIKK